MTRAAVQPEMFRWARERAGLNSALLETRFPRLVAWESGDAQPTLRQLEDYARATYAPIGYFFLPQPPAEPLPIPDFRTMADRAIRQPSPHLLDTVYACQQRQDWYVDYARVSGQGALPFIGSLSTATPVVEAAAQIRQTLGFTVEERRACPTWTEALRVFIEQADAAGIMVMVSGVVMNNTTRHLDPQEFRGFALSDPLAPLVFINGVDSKAAQMFTLAHELAHLWLGASALSDASADVASENSTEAWCNRVAELLVPTDMYCAELKRLRTLNADSTGAGDFYRTIAARVSKRFARALVESTLEGRTLFRDAFRMLGIAKTSTFNEFRRTLGFPLS